MSGPVAPSRVSRTALGPQRRATQGGSQHPRADERADARDPPVSAPAAAPPAAFTPASQKAGSSATSSQAALKYAERLLVSRPSMKAIRSWNRVCLRPLGLV